MELYWRYNLKAYCAFINKDNIDEIIASNGIKGDIGLLSVDIDGNDYWVWQAIDSVQARIRCLRVQRFVWLIGKGFDSV